jgi:CRISPR-associated protein Cmr6
MKLPLYTPNHAPAHCPASAHTGLWFDKFCNQWPAIGWSLKSVADRNPKLDWIRTVVGKATGDAKLLTEYAARMAGLARARGGEVFHFKTASRFATGLGREHPIENGFVWHPALGTPCLPGSSVKGLVREWAKTWDGAAEDALSRIFGPRDLRGIPASTGSVIFFDALPAKPVQIAADVMTPHYGPYYERGEVPGDWHSPVPIPFLTVAPGQSFVFTLAPRTPSESDRADCRIAADWLETALLELGAGAKTAVGYGRFERDATVEAEEKTAKERAAQAAREVAEKAAFAARLANISPLARELAQAAHDQRWENDANAFKAPDIVENWLARLEADPQADAIARLRGFLDRHFAGLLANPDLMGGKKKDTPVFKDRWRNLAKRLNALPKP